MLCNYMYMYMYSTCTCIVDAQYTMYMNSFLIAEAAHYPARSAVSTKYATRGEGLRRLVRCTCIHVRSCMFHFCTVF